MIVRFVVLEVLTGPNPLLLLLLLLFFKGLGGCCGPCGPRISECDLVGWSIVLRYAKAVEGQIVD
jgi:hypothetical protein